MKQKEKLFRFNKRSIKHSLTVDIDTKPIHGRMTQQNNMKTERITTMPQVAVVHCLRRGNFQSASRENFVSVQLLQTFPATAVSGSKEPALAKESPLLSQDYANSKYNSIHLMCKPHFHVSTFYFSFVLFSLLF